MPCTYVTQRKNQHNAAVNRPWMNCFISADLARCSTVSPEYFFIVMSAPAHSSCRTVARLSASTASCIGLQAKHQTVTALNSTYRQRRNLAHLLVTRSTQPCTPPGSLNRVPASSGVRAGMSPQVTLCDPMWYVSSRSGVATLRTARHLLLTCYLQGPS